MPETQALKAHAAIFADEAGNKSVSESERGTLVTFVASTASIDRDGEVIEVEGWEWNDGNLPKLLWGHDYHNADSVIGRLVRVYRDGARLMVDAELADKVPGHGKAALVAGLIRSGMLDQGSVGFMPKEWVDPDGKTYTRENPGSWYGSVPGRRYTKVELLEFSIVGVPSQRDSTLTAVRSLFDGATAEGGQHSGPERSTAGEDTASPESATTAPHAAPESWFAKRFQTDQPETAGADLSRAYLDRLTKGRPSGPA